MFRLVQVVKSRLITNSGSFSCALFLRICLAAHGGVQVWLHLLLPLQNSCWSEPCFHHLMAFCHLNWPAWILSSCYGHWKQRMIVSWGMMFEAHCPSTLRKPLSCDNPQFYWAKLPCLLAEKNLVANSTVIVEVHPWSFHLQTSTAIGAYDGGD